MKKNRRNSLLLFFLLLFIFFLGASFVLAQDKELEVKQYPLVPGAEAPSSVKTLLPQYFKYVLNLLLSLVGLVIFGALVYGGFRYLTAAGSPIKLGTAKKQIFAAFLGLLIILSSYFILYTINPQLVIFQVPEWVKVEPLPFSPPPSLEEQTLYAKEIPTGKLIDGVGKEYEGVLAKTRLDRIKKLSKETQETTKEIQKISANIKKAAKEIKKLTDDCSCSNLRDVSPKPCYGRTCITCELYGCIVGGDPCFNRRQIEGEEEKLFKLANQFFPLTDKLNELKEELKIEKEKLKKALVELEKAEGEMKKCPSSFSDQGKAQSLLNSDNFWQYKKGLEGQKIVKKVEIQPIWDNIKTGDDTFVFYCLEAPFEVSLEEGIPWEELEKELPETETTEPVKIYCETEIPLGKTMDDAEATTEKLVKEMEKIIKTIEEETLLGKILTEAGNAVYMADLPDSKDRKAMRRFIDQTLAGEIAHPLFDSYLNDQWKGFWGNPDTACKAWNQSPGCYGECEIRRDPLGNCVGCKIVFKGVPCLPINAIPKALERIEASHEVITMFYQEVLVFYLTVAGFNQEVNGEMGRIEGEGYELIDELKNARKVTGLIPTVDQTLKDLKTTRIRLNQCTNSSGDWIRAVFEAKILEKYILTCEESKAVCWDIEEDYQCYGENKPKTYTNYFCGEAKTP